MRDEARRIAVNLVRLHLGSAAKRPRVQDP